MKLRLFLAIEVICEYEYLPNNFTYRYKKTQVFEMYVDVFITLTMCSK